MCIYMIDSTRFTLHSEKSTRSLKSQKRVLSSGSRVVGLCYRNHVLEWEIGWKNAGYQHKTCDHGYLQSILCYIKQTLAKVSTQSPIGQQGYNVKLIHTHDGRVERGRGYRGAVTMCYWGNGFQKI